MYNRIRQIHLFAAFVLTVFILMYFVTGLVMIFEETFSRTDISTTTSITVIPGIRSVSDDSLVVVVKSQTGARGQFLVRRNRGQRQIQFKHPGTETLALVPADSDSVKLIVKKKNLAATFHHFHRLHGYYGGWNYILWAFFYDLSALSMIVFAFTGVYLWYKTERVKWPGFLILLVSTLITAFTIYYLQHLQ